MVSLKSLLFLNQQDQNRYLLIQLHAKSLQQCPTLCDPMYCTAHQAPLPMGFSRQEYQSGLPFHPLGSLLNPGIELNLLWLLQAGALPLVPAGKPNYPDSLPKRSISSNRTELGLMIPLPFKNIPLFTSNYSKIPFKVTHCTITLPHSTSSVLISLERNFQSLKEGPTQRKGLQLKKVFACGNEKQTETNHLASVSTWNVRSLAGICLYTRCYHFLVFFPSTWLSLLLLAQCNQHKLNTRFKHTGHSTQQY